MKQNMIAQKKFDSLIRSLLSVAEELDLEIKNNDGTLRNFTVNEMHCIDYIGKLENPNVTKLSDALNLTRGGVSRLIKRLITQSAIKTYTNNRNKKEIYYSLTPLGEKVFVAHEHLHNACHKYDSQFFKQFSQEEQEIAVRFIQQYIEHTKKYVTDFRKK